jgi:hypothetical protein
MHIFLQTARKQTHRHADSIGHSGRHGGLQHFGDSWGELEIFAVGKFFRVDVCLHLARLQLLPASIVYRRRFGLSSGSYRSWQFC